MNEPRVRRAVAVLLLAGTVVFELSGDPIRAIALGLAATLQLFVVFGLVRDVEREDA